MELDWEHRVETGLPVYMQVSRENMIFHLNEHSGDCTPGSEVFVNTNALDNLRKKITRKATNTISRKSLPHYGARK